MDFILWKQYIHVTIPAQHRPPWLESLPRTELCHLFYWLFFEILYIFFSRFCTFMPEMYFHAWYNFSLFYFIFIFHFFIFIFLYFPAQMDPPTEIVMARFYLIFQLLLLLSYLHSSWHLLMNASDLRNKDALNLNLYNFLSFSYFPNIFDFGILVNLKEHKEWVDFTKKNEGFCYFCSE